MPPWGWQPCQAKVGRLRSKLTVLRNGSWILRTCESLAWLVGGGSYFLRSKECQTPFEISLKKLTSGKLTLRGYGMLATLHTRLGGC